MKILMVVHRSWWDRKNPPFWPMIYHALAARDDVSIAVTGPRWDGFDHDATLPQNVDRLMPDADVVFIWRPFGAAEFCGVNGAELPLRALKVSAYQDEPRKGAIEAVKAGLDLAVYHDHWDRQFFAPIGVRSVHVPLAVDMPLYAAGERPFEQRRYPAVVTGNQKREVYPLRYRFRQLIRKRWIPGKVRPASFYRYNTFAEVREEQRRYAAELCLSKVALVTSSTIAPLTMRKYFEGLAAGCAIVGEMPFCPPEDVRDCIVRVDRKMSDEEIAKRITPLMEEPALWREHHERNRRVAANYTYEKFAERFLVAVRESLAERPCTST